MKDRFKIPLGAFLLGLAVLFFTLVLAYPYSVFSYVDVLYYLEAGLIRDYQFLSRDYSDMERDLLEFCQEKNEPEYWLGMASFAPDYYKAIGYIRQAEQADPNNPVYPYLKGITYGGLLSSRNMYFKHESGNDSAMVNLQRAAELAPGNAAPLLAMSVISIQRDTTRLSDCYIFLRDNDASVKFLHLPDSARVLIDRASELDTFLSYDTEISRTAIKLLSDSGNETFGTKDYLYKIVPRQNFKTSVLPIKLYTKPLDSYQNFSALAWRLSKISEIAVLIRRDPTASLHQILYATTMFDICHDVIGDIGLMEDDSLLVATASHSRAIGELWGALWQHSMAEVDMYPFSLRDEPYYSLLFAVMLLLPPVAIICAILLLLILIRGYSSSEINRKTLSWMGWGLALLILVIFLSELKNRIPAYVVSAIPLLLAIDTVVTYYRKRTGTLVLPGYFFCLSICAFVVTAWGYYPVVLAIPPLAIFFSANESFEKGNRKKGLLVSFLFLDLSRLFLVLSVTLAIIWAAAGNKLAFTNASTVYNLNFQMFGTSHSMPYDAWERFGSHYTGRQAQRIERLRELNLLP